jgi:membrane protease YdiL (CAAX protease family)
MAATVSVALLASAQGSVVWLGERLTGRTWGDVLPVRIPSILEVVAVLGAFGGLQLAKAGLLLSVVVTPIAEEAFFRGLLLGGFLLAYRRLTAILLTALLFAAIHVDPVQAVGAGASGAFLGWLMAASGNLALPVLAHAAGNALALAPARFPDLLGTIASHPVTSGILGLFVLGLGTLLLRQALRPAPRPSLTTGVA